MEDLAGHGENHHMRAGEWFPHRLASGEDQPLLPEDALAMWDLIARDFLASLPLED